MAIFGTTLQHGELVAAVRTSTTKGTIWAGHIIAKARGTICAQVNFIDKASRRAGAVWEEDTRE